MLKRRHKWTTSDYAAGYFVLLMFIQLLPYMMIIQGGANDVIILAYCFFVLLHLGLSLRLGYDSSNYDNE